MLDLRWLCCFVFVLMFGCLTALAQIHRTESFDNNWKFMLGDDSLAKYPAYNDSKWRVLNLPHDWSIEGGFNEKNPSTQAEGGLPTGIGWYRKTFKQPLSSKSKKVFIDFDGVYRDSEVWINGHYLGKRPNGYISFRDDLTSYLKFGDTENVIAVRMDNSGQPNSRWYTGSGIYRNVWLRTINKTHFTQWGTFITTPQINDRSATVHISTNINSAGKSLHLKTTIYDKKGVIVAGDLTSLENSTTSNRNLVF